MHIRGTLLLCHSTSSSQLPLSTHGKFFMSQLHFDQTFIYRELRMTIIGFISQVSINM